MSTRLSRRTLVQLAFATGALALTRRASADQGSGSPRLGDQGSGSPRLGDQGSGSPRLADQESGSPRLAEPLDDALARIAAARASLRTLVGPFTQERTISLLSTSVRSQGKVYLVRPDRLRWELDPPDDVVYWITPEGLAYRSKTGQGRVPAAQARLASSLDDLRTLLGGDLSHLRARYDLHLLPGKDGEVAFEATPRDPAMPLKLLRFGVAADGVTPKFAELFESGKDKTRIEFGALQRDVPVDPSLVRPPL